ncbi:MAG: tRNA (N6-isopentenyl adenosine(37)-C2)-methylthiotransferase MiaB [Lachnospiraceae bacterium]|nr:tRNA (N6-isopentenyl adenosine(37)-C2)-methylthiotransferase MiaB [Lachnospiraceae bacterium]
MNEINLELIDTSGNAPMDEPNRQYYFMAKCKALLEKRSQELGRPLYCQTRTFGCQMNARDSEKLTGILEQIGYVETEEHEPDFVLYNTCTVRENANLKVYGHLGYLKKQKAKNPGMMIALCGCMMQEPTVVEKIKKSYRFVDLIFGTHNIYKLAELIYEKLTTGKNVIEIWEDTTKIVEELPIERKYPFKSGVNIMFGCNNFCSYCIVPYVRGRERSRKPEDIINEIKKLVADGVVEIMLLGQNVNSYGKNLEKPVSFAELLKMVEEIEGLKRIRFMTSHPKDLSDELIEVMKNSKKICRQLHLPLQSGSSRILKIMNRHYDKEQYIALAQKIKSEIPDISLTTDIIVGFPGETEEDFAETLDVVKQVRYDSAYTFIYSKRTGTPAAEMENQVPQDVVKERFDRLLAQVQTISAEQTQKNVGKTLEALVEEMNEQDASLVTGRLSNGSVVHFPGTKELIGKIVSVKLEEAKGFYYMGTMQAE